MGVSLIFGLHLAEAAIQAFALHVEETLETLEPFISLVQETFQVAY